MDWQKEMDELRRREAFAEELGGAPSGSCDFANLAAPLRRPEPTTHPMRP
jgi:hypothetical protein